VQQCTPALQLGCPSLSSRILSNRNIQRGTQMRCFSLFLIFSLRGFGVMNLLLTQWFSVCYTRLLSVNKGMVRRIQAEQQIARCWSTSGTTLRTQSSSDALIHRKERHDEHPWQAQSISGQHERIFDAIGWRYKASEYHCFKIFASCLAQPVSRLLLKNRKAFKRRFLTCLV